MTRFPGTEVVASNYPPSTFAVAASKAVNLGTFACIGLTHFGDAISTAFGFVATPEFVTNLQSNKMGSTMGAWFVGNTVSTNLLNTGAFEVFYDGEVIFSKNGEKRLPTIPEIMGNLETAMRGYKRAAAALEPGAVQEEALPEEARGGEDLDVEF
jgi:selT/selW/selH-like putative selenoprotein|tara:strand:- start:14903 stop:15367 length:465 start_codon:yes stop_codon:yes gene_type:complete|eukprot:CAMPEP_0119211302 /NCGR_PEP_ID=MMETSP1327-20130426/2857_1 /TAXON_ID=38833 /ORGANISM="Micromonas pusilla, Strain RCC2306" /LENGTH=154 /DNA_ID=CAMNT_0007208421 /DNA_START=220 /DNA_END=684 /DNA_ORIENTATION=+